MDETNVAEYDKKFWPYDATLALIDIVEARYDELHHPNKRKHVWQNVSTDLESANIFVTANICQKKWQNLLRSYKACKENMNKIGRGPMRFKFFQRIDELIGDEPHINKKHEISFINIDSASTSSLELNPQTETDCLERVCTVSNSSEEDPLPTSPLDHPIKEKKRKNSQTEHINLKKQYLKLKEAEWKKRREEKNKREDKKLELYERKLNLEERKIRVLEELIKLRKKNK